MPGLQEGIQCDSSESEPLRVTLKVTTASMAENRVTIDENFTYEARLPRLVTAMGLFVGSIGGYFYPIYYKLPTKYSFTKYMPLAMLVGGGMGLAVDTLYCMYRDRQRAFVQEYIANHPEDFVETPAPKYKDILLPWHPSR